MLIINITYSKLKILQTLRFPSGWMGSRFLKASFGQEEVTPLLDGSLTRAPVEWWEFEMISFFPHLVIIIFSNFNQRLWSWKRETHYSCTEIISTMLSTTLSSVSLCSDHIAEEKTFEKKLLNHKNPQAIDYKDQCWGNQSLFIGLLAFAKLGSEEDIWWHLCYGCKIILL